LQAVVVVDFMDKPLALELADYFIWHRKPLLPAHTMSRLAVVVQLQQIHIEASVVKVKIRQLAHLLPQSAVAVVDHMMVSPAVQAVQAVAVVEWQAAAVVQAAETQAVKALLAEQVLHQATLQAVAVVLEKLAILMANLQAEMVHRLILHGVQRQVLDKMYRVHIGSQAAVLDMHPALVDWAVVDSSMGQSREQRTQAVAVVRGITQAALADLVL
jgi:hypothetical protein